MGNGDAGIFKRVIVSLVEHPHKAARNAIPRNDCKRTVNLPDFMIAENWPTLLELVELLAVSPMSEKAPSQGRLTACGKNF
jgi:hypothetical protein